MSDKRRQEFESKVQAVISATREYAEDRLSGRGDWFVRGLDHSLQNAVDALLNFGVESTPHHESDESVQRQRLAAAGNG